MMRGFEELRGLIDPDGGVAGRVQEPFGAAKRDTLPRQWRACEVRWLCNGACPKDRGAETDRGARRRISPCRDRLHVAGDGMHGGVATGGWILLAAA